MSSSNTPGAAKPEPKHSWGEARTPPDPMQHPLIEDKEGRIDYIATLQVRGKYRKSRTRNELSIRWGVKKETIVNYACEASRQVIREARARGGECATTAVETLLHVAKHAKTSECPGDKAAAVAASKELLRFAGAAEPEEDKSRPSTVQIVQIGQTATSPAMQGLVGGLMTNGSATTIDTVEAPPVGELPAQGGDDAVEGPARSPDADAGQGAPDRR